METLFGSPAMLWWAGAATVPLVLHLLSRRRFRRVPWAAMELLERAFKKTRKRLRMENLLLLLLRMLALILLAVALADPRVEGGVFGGGEARNVFVVVDTSFSMDARDASDQPTFARARRAAARLLDTLEGEGDAAALVTAGSPSQLVLPLTREIDRVREGLERLESTEASTDTLGALRVVAGLLAEPGLDVDFPGGRVVYVVTDLQKSSFLAPAASAPGEESGEVSADAPEAGWEEVLREIKDRKARLVFVDVGELDEESRRNVAVTELAHSGKSLVQGVETGFEGRIRNFGELDAGGEIRFSVDQEETFLRSERVELLPGRASATDAETEQAFTFSATFDRPGWHYVSVRYLDDALKVDNVRRLAFWVRENIRVLAVSGRPRRDEEVESAFYVARALDPAMGSRRGGTSFRVREIGLAALPSATFAEEDLVILTDVAEMSPGKVRELEDFVRGGGALMVFPGPSFEAAGRLGEDGGTVNLQFHRDGEGLLPARLVRVEGGDELTENPYALQFETFDHPATAYFSDPKIRPGVTRMPIFKFLDARVDPEDQDSRVLASFRFARGEGSDTRTWPALIEKRVGEGRVLLFTSSADTRWNLLGVSPAFVPLMREAAYHLTRRARRGNLTVGDTLVERFPATVESVRIARGQEPAVERATSLSPDRGSAEILLPRLDRAETLRIEYETPEGGTETRLIAVNVDPEESDLRRAGEGWLTLHFGTELLTVVREVEELGARLETARTSSLWRRVLWVLLGILVFETILARRIGSRQTATA